MNTAENTPANASSTLRKVCGVACLLAAGLILGCGQAPSFNEKQNTSRQSGSSDDPGRSTADQGTIASNQGSTHQDAKLPGGQDNIQDAKGGAPGDKTAVGTDQPDSNGKGKNPDKGAMGPDGGKKGGDKGGDKPNGGDKGTDKPNGGDKNPGTDQNGGKKPGDGTNNKPPKSDDKPPMPPKDPANSPVKQVVGEAGGVDGTVLICIDFKQGTMKVGNVGKAKWYAANFNVTVNTDNGPVVKKFTPKVNVPYPMSGKWDNVCDATPVVTTLKPHQMDGRRNPPAWGIPPRLNVGTQRCFYVDDGADGRPGPVTLKYKWDVTNCK